MGGHLQTIKTGSGHLAAPFHRTVLKCHIFLFDIGIHHRSGFVIHLHMVEQCARLEYIDNERCRLANLVVPVFMVGSDGNTYIIAAYLC